MKYIKNLRLSCQAQPDSGHNDSSDEITQPTLGEDETQHSRTSENKIEILSNNEVAALLGIDQLEDLPETESGVHWFRGGPGGGGGASAIIIHDKSWFKNLKNKSHKRLPTMVHLASIVILVNIWNFYGQPAEASSKNVGSKNVGSKNVGSKNVGSKNVGSKNVGSKNVSKKAPKKAPKKAKATGLDGAADLDPRFYLDIAQNQEPNRANGSDGQRSGIYHHIFDDLKTNESVAVYVGRGTVRDSDDKPTRLQISERRLLNNNYHNPNVQQIFNQYGNESKLTVWAVRPHYSHDVLLNHVECRTIQTYVERTFHNLLNDYLNRQNTHIQAMNELTDAMANPWNYPWTKKEIAKQQKSRHSGTVPFVQEGKVYLDMRKHSESELNMSLLRCWDVSVSPRYTAFSVDFRRGSVSHFDGVRQLPVEFRGIAYESLDKLYEQKFSNLSKDDFISRFLRRSFHDPTVRFRTADQAQQQFFEDLRNEYIQAVLDKSLIPASSTDDLSSNRTTSLVNGLTTKPFCSNSSLTPKKVDSKLKLRPARRKRRAKRQEPVSISSQTDNSASRSVVSHPLDIQSHPVVTPSKTVDTGRGVGYGSITQVRFAVAAPSPMPMTTSSNANSISWVGLGCVVFILLLPWHKIFSGNRSKKCPENPPDLGHQTDASSGSDWFTPDEW